MAICDFSHSHTTRALATPTNLVYRRHTLMLKLLLHTSLWTPDERERTKKLNNYSHCFIPLSSPPRGGVRPFRAEEHRCVCGGNNYTKLRVFNTEPTTQPSGKCRCVEKGFSADARWEENSRTAQDHIWRSNRAAPPLHHCLYV